jgi:hypothetical protein
MATNRRGFLHGMNDYRCGLGLLAEAGSGPGTQTATQYRLSTNGRPILPVAAVYGQ